MGVGNIKIRPPRRKEFIQIRDCHVASIRRLCGKDYSSEQIEVWAGRQKPHQYKMGQRRGAVVLVAVRCGRVLGVGGLYGGEIVLLYVHPDYAGMGAGKALLFALEREARKKKIETLQLHSTLTAESFYLRHGFRSEKQTSVTVRGVLIPCTKMTRVLSRAGT